ncbi:hypothetical protein AC579_7278 [Pseudocercospora musae]|uniref:Dyp-type peroxidase n=1 Tax=Pseudocercospora musae TaxID=113226 RepID=A0A139GVR4_9PEZI|nr:hypothetical protein AC579_7278 [Pseudocercospora musae]
MTSFLTDLSNVQGDILLSGLNKEVETFCFFTITQGQEKKFCQNLRKVADEISHTQNTLDTKRNIKHLKANAGNAGNTKLPTVGANISFSFKGLQKVDPMYERSNISSVTGVSTNIADNVFQTGMKQAAVQDLQDPPRPNADGNTPNWEDDWLTKQIDGVLLIAGNTTALIQEKLNQITRLFNDSIKLAFEISGQVRPGENKGHEHFGYLDGVSQPSIKNLPALTKEEAFVPPGQDSIDQGIILCGRPGDVSASLRPAWMVDGSFLCFRKLKQNVQAWQKFLQDSSNTLGTWPDLLGARLIGRWKSGCPVNSSPDFDDRNAGKDIMRNNLFEFDPPGLDQVSTFDQPPGSRIVCPIGAHVRKTNPRGDLGRKNVDRNRILRRGIPYGPEIEEDADAERGLLFVCYQSNLNAGFEFIQKFWANNPTFRFPGGGVDAVMGQINGAPGATVGMMGLFPQDASRQLQLPGVNRFVVARGGEYFFSPSLSALRNELSNVNVKAANGVNGHEELKH